MSSDRLKRDGGSRRTRGKSVDGSESDRETRGQESESPPRTRRGGRGSRRKRRAGNGRCLRKLADMHDVATNGSNMRKDRDSEDSDSKEREHVEHRLKDCDREEPVSEQSCEEPDYHGSGDDTYQEKLRILDKIEDIRQQRESLKDQIRAWEREYCDDEKHPVENYRERDNMDELADETYWDYQEVKDTIAEVEKNLERLDVKSRRLRDEKDAEAEGYEDLFKSTRKELLRAKEKRDKVLVKIQEQLQEKQEIEGEMKMIEHESHEIKESIKECQEDVDLINHYDVDMETKSIMSLQDMASSLDSNLEVLHAQSKNAVEEERRYESKRQLIQEEADVWSENLAILRKKEEKVIVKSRSILKEFRSAFNPLRFAEIAREENSRTKRSIVPKFFSRRQAPMSNEKDDHCRRSIKQIEETLRGIPSKLQPRRNHDDESESENVDDFNAELRSLIIHLLTKTGNLMLDFNELLQREHDFGDDRMYTLMQDMEDSFEYENEIEMIKANAISSEYSRTLKRLKALKKLNKQLRDERKFRKESMKKFQDNQSKYRRTCRDQNDQLKEINEDEIENKYLRKEVEYLKDRLKNITTQLTKRDSQLHDARDLVWSTVRHVGSEKRGHVRERGNYYEERKYTDYNPSDSDDAESLREHALQEIARWDDEDLHGRSKRADPSKYPRSGRRDSFERETRGTNDSPKCSKSPKSRSRSPRSDRHSPEGHTPGYDEYDNKREDPPSAETPGTYNDGSRR